ncbi:hypothetical protein L1887_49538 [Cichorium endivia]|nr:hypothetical protein L1887_49538 [Cichorium endivia]
MQNACYWGVLLLLVVEVEDRAGSYCARPAEMATLVCRHREERRGVYDDLVLSTLPLSTHVAVRVRRVICHTVSETAHGHAAGRDLPGDDHHHMSLCGAHFAGVTGRSRAFSAPESQDRLDGAGGANKVVTVGRQQLLFLRDSLVLVLQEGVEEGGVQMQMQRAERTNAGGRSARRKVQE